jgi:hypothetical protein
VAGTGRDFAAVTEAVYVQFHEFVHVFIGLVAI